jgi:outer membrane protein OmpA-like peptidoglycan-associated protein
MKKLISLIIAVSFAAVLTGCKSSPPPGVENPDKPPELTVAIPELFSPSPDIADDKMTINIAVNHPAPIKDWHIVINRQIGTQAASGQTREAPQGETQRPQRQSSRERARNFFDQNGNGTPPAQWQWDGKRTSGEMVQSATDYSFTLTVTDVFDNFAVFNGTISVDVLVKREGNDLRMIVPSIVFPPNSADFSLLSDQDRRANTRVLRLIANALNKYPDYRITVEGHANPTTAPNSAARTSEEAGTASVIGLRPLSEARAQAVANSLSSDNGINASRMNVVGMGGTRTVAAYNDADENWKNRRVEFLLHR